MILARDSRDRPGVAYPIHCNQFCHRKVLFGRNHGLGIVRFFLTSVEGVTAWAVFFTLVRTTSLYFGDLHEVSLPS